MAVRRLSRKTDATSSPQRQGDQILQATVDVGGHIIAWADDWEVSGATDPLTRKGFGPWLRGEMGPYDGIASSTVDRVGRNVRDTLNTQALLTGQDRIVVTADHAGVWVFQRSEPGKRVAGQGVGVADGAARDPEAQPGRDGSGRARRGSPSSARLTGTCTCGCAPMAKVDHVELDPVGAEIIREVARRILADETGKITIRDGSGAPDARGNSRRRATGAPQLYGRPVKGGPWTRAYRSSTFCAVRRRSGTS